MTHFDLATLCRDAYDTIPGALSLWDGSAWIVECGAGEPAIIVFRGSSNVLDWLEDVRVNLAPSPWGLVHEGFLAGWRCVAPELHSEIGEHPVILTGHSLGGALATIAALALPNVREVVTFGAPRAGGAAFVAAYRALGIPTARYVHGCDPIAHVPGLLSWLYNACRFRRLKDAWTASLYWHTGAARWWSGSAWRDGIDWLSWLATAWEYIRNRDVDGWLEEHRIDGYCSALAATVVPQTA